MPLRSSHFGIGKPGGLHRADGGGEQPHHSDDTVRAGDERSQVDCHAGGDCGRECGCDRGVGCGGSAQSLAIIPSKYGVFAFDATQGQYLSVQINSLTTTTPVAATIGYQVYSPTAALVASGSTSAASNIRCK